MKVLLSTAYFPPIIYFNYLIQQDCTIEGFENFQKQSYRNRCNILTANGTEQLIVPIKHHKFEFVPIQEQEISYAENWQIKHWRSIISAYNHAPFFEFYKDDLNAILMQKYLLLFELNQSLLKLTLANLQLNTPSISNKWELEPTDFIDKRNAIHPKNENESISQNYHQVFSKKFGFTPNLSILDLLFNLGPEAHLFLLKNK